ncbi:MAG: tetratricopeptide repeat protein [Gemmatales bacterium]|nr:tetratricopeptide repeat protein [Gemmatales bacterium]MDW8174742.1 tetratricopeptide repeat protein [Gemmatales bacterium]
MPDKYRILWFSSLSWCVATASLAQSDMPLPAPRPLPLQTDQTGPTCHPDRRCRIPERTDTADTPTASQLRQELERLRLERERLRQIRTQPVLPVRPDDVSDAEVLQRQVQRLLMQWVVEGKVPENPLTPPQSKPTTLPESSAAPDLFTGENLGKPVETRQTGPTTSGDKPHRASSTESGQKDPPLARSGPPQAPSQENEEKPLAPMELGQTLFQAGNYEAAFAAFRLVEPITLSREDRLLLQYLQATCLRKLGRTEEAVKLYRDIANSRSEAFAVECAQWQLSHLRWQQETQRRLQQIRTWREQRPAGR